MKARRGQTVSFYAKLRKDQQVAYLQVFSSVGDYEPSPYIPMPRIGILERGRPILTSTLDMRLNEPMRPQGVIRFTCDEDADYYLMQEVDLADDQTVKARTHRHVRSRIQVALSALRRLVGRR